MVLKIVVPWIWHFYSCQYCSYKFNKPPQEYFKGGCWVHKMLVWFRFSIFDNLLTVAECLYLLQFLQKSSSLSFFLFFIKLHFCFLFIVLSAWRMAFIPREEAAYILCGGFDGYKLWTTLLLLLNVLWSRDQFTGKPHSRNQWMKREFFEHISDPMELFYLSKPTTLRGKGHSSIFWSNCYLTFTFLSSFGGLPPYGRGCAVERDF